MITDFPKDWVDIRRQLPRANPQNAAFRTLAEISTGIVHYDAEFAGEGLTDGDELRRYTQQAAYHISKNWNVGPDGRPRSPRIPGFALMYHVKVSRRGRIYLCNDFELQTWQANLANHRGIGVCFDLGKDQTPSIAQLQAGQRVLDFLSLHCPSLPNINRASWYGHGELKADRNVTACPGRMLPFVQAYRQQPMPVEQTAITFPNGKTLAGAFLKYWLGLGQLAVPLLGYPLTDPRRETLADSIEHVVQYTERARLELHGEDVLLGLLGAEALARQ